MATKGIRKIIEVISIVLLVSSCTPQKRLHRIIKNHPELLQLDTIILVDTIVIEDYSHDTTTIFKFHDSTTVVNNEKVILKYFYDTLTREIHHEYTCLGDTIVQEKIIPYEKIVIQELTWWQKYGNIIITITIILLLLTLFKKFSKFFI